MIVKSARTLVLCLGLAACGSAPPTPTDRFYRLQAATIGAAAKPLPGPLAVQPLRAESLYAERPIVFSEESDPRQLRQYHYHLWVYAPPQLLHEHMRASLGKALAVTADDTAPYTLDGRIVRLERVTSDKNGKAVAMLELRLSSAGKTLLAKTYQAEQIAADGSMTVFVAALEQALGRIYVEFIRDVETLGSGKS